MTSTNDVVRRSAHVETCVARLPQDDDLEGPKVLLAHGTWTVSEDAPLDGRTPLDGSAHTKTSQGRQCGVFASSSFAGRTPSPESDAVSAQDLALQALSHIFCRTQPPGKCVRKMGVY